MDNSIFVTIDFLTCCVTITCTNFRNISLVYTVAFESGPRALQPADSRELMCVYVLRMRARNVLEVLHTM